MTNANKIEKRVQEAAKRDQDNLTKDMHRTCKELEFEDDLMIWGEKFPPSVEALKEIENWCGYSEKGFLNLVSLKAECRRWYEKEYEHQTYIAHKENLLYAGWIAVGALALANLVSFIIFISKIV